MQFWRDLCLPLKEKMKHLHILKSSDCTVAAPGIHHFYKSAQAVPETGPLCAWGCGWARASNQERRLPLLSSNLVPSLLQQSVSSAVENSASLQAFCSQSLVDDSVTELFLFFINLPCRDFQIISLKCFSPHLGACLICRRHNPH